VIATSGVGVAVGVGVDVEAEVDVEVEVAVDVEAEVDVEVGIDVEVGVAVDVAFATIAEIEAEATTVPLEFLPSILIVWVPLVAVVVFQLNVSGGDDAMKLLSI
jgi:hypothetical protein